MTYLWQWFLETGWLLLVISCMSGGLGMSIGFALKKWYIEK